MRFLQRFFLPVYLIYGVLIAIFSVLIDSTIFPYIEKVPHYWLVFGFLFIIVLVAYGVSYFGIQKGGQTATVAILSGIIVKMLFAMLLPVFYLKKYSDNQTVFAFSYFSLVLLFSVFELIGLLSNLRDQKNS
ncbi:hypothetical protein [Olivibacter sitiensis]|uniref:hypothetical protein n=1 Tax=Olivibacter sitiensis TaxID=376470 RepID=UPI000488908E|nr:hypothetical protein [Olivibacter sitiensis]